MYIICPCIIGHLNAYACWRHQMEAFSALLAFCAGNSPVTGEFPTQRPVTRSFDVFFELRLNKRLSKHSWGWWFETLSWSLWRHCDENFSKCVDKAKHNIYIYIYIYIKAHIQIDEFIHITWKLFCCDVTHICTRVIEYLYESSEYFMSITSEDMNQNLTSKSDYDEELSLPRYLCHEQSWNEDFLTRW